jgi:hypothetical protein
MKSEKYTRKDKERDKVLPKQKEAALLDSLILLLTIIHYFLYFSKILLALSTASWRETGALELW